MRLRDYGPVGAARRSNVIETWFVVTMCVAFVFARAFIFWPSLSWRAEFWAESGSQFFCQALAPASWDSFFALDSGYLAVLPRLASFIVVTIGGAREFAPLLQQCAAFLFIAVCGAVFALRVKNYVSANVFVRVAMALLLLSHWGYGMFVFNNFTYYAVIPVALILVGLLNAENPVNLKWTAILPVMLLNKPYFLAFFPVLSLILVRSLRLQTWKACMISVVSLGALTIQVATTVVNKAAFHAKPIEVSQLVRSLKVSFFLIFHAFGDVLIGRSIGNAGDIVRVSAIIVTALLFIGLLVRLGHLRRWQSLLAIAIMLSAAFITELMTAVVFFPDGVDFAVVPTFRDDSHHFFAMALILMSVLVALFSFLKKTSAQFLVLIAVFWGSNVFGFWDSVDPVKNSFPAPTTWSQEYQKIADKHYDIPINPEGWTLLHEPSRCRGI